MIGPGGRAVVELAAWVAGRRIRYRVWGASMEPTLADGEYVLIDPARRLEPGALVLARVPQVATSVVKRVEWATSSAGSDPAEVWLASDNPDLGTDSRTWGSVDLERVEGTVTLNLSRPLASLERPHDRPAAQSRAWWLRR
jgi:hypothetical protein